MKAPVIESTGTGGGMKLFCAGVGAQHPDIVNASRPMKASEYATCKANGAADVIEAQVGLDGRSEEHTSELQSLMRISYAVFCLKKKHPQHPLTPANRSYKQKL